jgi:hypothetical protein
MKRVFLLAFIALIGLVAFLLERGVFLTPPEGSTLDSVIHTLFQGGTTTALLIIEFILFALIFPGDSAALPSFAGCCIRPCNRREPDGKPGAVTARVD